MTARPEPSAKSAAQRPPSGGAGAGFDVGHVLLLVVATLAMQAVAWFVLFRIPAITGWHWGLWSTDGDLRVYYRYAAKMAQGLLPFRDFPIEYPPLFVPLIWIDRLAPNADAFVAAFERLMVGFSAVTALLVAFAAEDGVDKRRPYAAAAMFSLGVVAIGGLAVNRYDMVVAAILALFLLCMVRGWWEVAGIVLGVGFALKITPAVLLPLLLFVAPWRRGRWALAGFAVVAVVPFAVAAASGPHGIENLRYMLDYHLVRPLEVGSVAGTPIWFAHLPPAPPVQILHTAASRALGGAPARLAASLTGPATAAGLLFAYGMLWWRRDALRGDRRTIALAATALLLVALAFAKVLSPQYFVWMAPPMALVFLERRTLGLLLLLTTAITQVVFPITGDALLASSPHAVYVLAARNGLIVVCMVLAFVHLARLPRSAPARA